MSQPLDRHRPLWEVWLTEGFGGDRWAGICKVHHSMVDGIAGVGLLELLLDLSSEIDVAEPQDWSPSPEPSVAAMVGYTWNGGRRGPYRQPCPTARTRDGDPSCHASTAFRIATFSKHSDNDWDTASDIDTLAVGIGAGISELASTT